MCCSLAACDGVSHIHSIASLYSDIVNCLHCAASGVIPTTRCNCVFDEHNTPGWNEYVKDAHSEARDAFKLWILSSKPRHGDVFQSRARFKIKLRQCKRDEARTRSDILADDICAAYGDVHDITFNHAKTVCMYLPSKGNCTLNPPHISLNLQKLSFVPKFKYVGSFITQDNSHDDNNA